jgi:hypothetical protein
MNNKRKIKKKKKKHFQFVAKLMKLDITKIISIEGQQIVVTIKVTADCSLGTT